MSEPMPEMRRLVLLAAALASLLIAACVPTQEPDPTLAATRDAKVVLPTPGSTAETLSRDYLGDPDQAHRILEFNQVEAVQPNQYLAVPLTPFRKGGLYPQGIQEVPVLMYHSLSENKTTKLTISRQRFEEQMRHLKTEGFTTISLDRLLDFIDFKNDLPPRSVAITFDDGWCSVYTIAFPILKQFGFTATCFIYSDHIRNTKCLTWDNLREMSDYGIAVQSHSRSHRYMDHFKEDEAFPGYLGSIIEEIIGSKKIIEDQLGKPCIYFAYPYGRSNNLVVTLLKQHGFRAGFSAKAGSNAFFQDPFLIRRTNVYGDWDLDRFKEALTVYQTRDLK